MRRQSICLLTLDFVGPIRNGGIGTAFLALAETLVAAGHDVTVLYPSSYTETEPVTRWRTHYATRGVEFVSLFLEGSEAALSLGAYQWLKTRRFDVIHFHEMRGIGYWTTVAKRCGLGFGDTTLVCHVHSPTLWHFAHSAQFLTHSGELETDWMEQRSAEGADFVTAPSRYILDVAAGMGWRLPGQTTVMPNLLPTRFTDRTPRQAPPSGPMEELVFFGRLEERKGLGLFCEAITRLIRAGQAPARVTFLGKVGHMAGVHALAWLAGAAQHWPMPWSVVNDADPHQARDYLAGPGRLAVIASRMENAPYVVLECLAAGLPFLAPDVGGIGELVAAEDRARLLYPRHAAALAEALAQALRDGVAPGRAAISPEATARLWLDWHAALPPPAAPAVHTAQPLVSVCMAAFNRHEPLAHAIASLERQDYPRLELILVDDASTDPAARRFHDALRPRFAARGWTLLRNPVNSWQGITRHRAVEAAQGEFLLFMDDDNAAWPDEVSTFVHAAQHSGADILTCQMQAFRGAGPPPRHRSTRPIGWIPLGACPALGVFRNGFGDANMFMRRTAWDRMGGFTLDRAYFEDWEFLQAASLAGLHLECLPEILFSYRIWEGAQTAAHDPDFLYRSYARAMRPAVAALPEALRPALRLAIEKELAGQQARHEAYWAHAPHVTADQAAIGRHPPNSAEAMLAAAAHALNQRQPGAARLLAAQALRIAPGHPDALRLMARISETAP
ncbi:glycosyltransferase [Sediminicoccus sp. KRV36]|uniref:glycosyltransferase n=1 Tax=Sediminicoccus sp. KRV36 TaxID=3133721 RepID=UPI0024B05219|nr:glycosyltransferase [Sediminicoccus rosea]